MAHRVRWSTEEENWKGTSHRNNRIGRVQTGVKDKREKEVRKKENKKEGNEGVCLGVGR